MDTEPVGHAARGRQGRGSGPALWRAQARPRSRHPSKGRPERQDGGRVGGRTGQLDEVQQICWLDGMQAAAGPELGSGLVAVGAFVVLSHRMGGGAPEMK